MVGLHDVMGGKTFRMCDSVTSAVTAVMDSKGPNPLSDSILRLGLIRSVVVMD